MLNERDKTAHNINQLLEQLDEQEWVYWSRRNRKRGSSFECEENSESRKFESCCSPDSKTALSWNKTDVEYRFDALDFGYNLSLRNT